MSLFGRSKITVGLDIGSSLIKAAVIDHSNGTPELTSVALTPIVQDAIVEGEIMDPTLVADAIRATIAETGPRLKSAVTAVGGRDVIVKRIQTERVKLSQARELIRWEAEQHIPDVESVELDFHILDSNNFDDEMSVLLVAAKRELVENRLRIISDAGLDSSLVDIDAFALFNALEFNHPDAMVGGVALVNVGHEITGITILDQGTPILTRDIMVGTRRFREDLQQAHDQLADVADASVRDVHRSPELDAVLEPRCDEIAAGIERAATFLATSGRSATEVNAVFLCGGGARTPGLPEILASRLNRPVKQANPLANLMVRDGALDAFTVPEIAPLLMLPIGLALRQA